jgi:hypothetical protein
MSLSFKVSYVAHLDVRNLRRACFILLVACLILGAAIRMLLCSASVFLWYIFCQACRTCVAYTVFSFLWHVLLSGLQGLCCVFCFLLLVMHKNRHQQFFVAAGTCLSSLYRWILFIEPLPSHDTKMHIQTHRLKEETYEVRLIMVP